MGDVYWAVSKLNPTLEHMIHHILDLSALFSQFRMRVQVFADR